MATGLRNQPWRPQEEWANKETTEDNLQKGRKRDQGKGRRKADYVEEMAKVGARGL